MLGAYQLPYHFISVNLGTLRLTISTPTLATWLQLETLMDFQNNISDMDFFFISLTRSSTYICSAMCLKPANVIMKDFVSCRHGFFANAMVPSTCNRAWQQQKQPITFCFIEWWLFYHQGDLNVGTTQHCMHSGQWRPLSSTCCSFDGQFTSSTSITTILPCFFRHPWQPWQKLSAYCSNERPLLHYFPCHEEPNAGLSSEWARQGRE